MSQRRRIVVDPATLGPKDVDSLDGTGGCPAPLLGRCLAECYYTLRPSKRPNDYHIDPTVFVEPVWSDTYSTNVQADDEEITDTLVESRPLRLMSTAFSQISAPPIPVQSSQATAVELDDIEWFTTEKPGRQEFMMATKQRLGKVEPPVLEKARQREWSNGATYAHGKEIVQASSGAPRQVQGNRIVLRATRYPDTWEATGSVVKQQQMTKAPLASAHQYEWFRSTLGWATS